MSQEKNKITRKQILGARGLLEMSQADLAKAAGLSVQALTAIEQGKSVARDETLRRIREALEHRGIEFSNGDEPGIKLRPSKAIIPM